LVISIQLIHDARLEKCQAMCTVIVILRFLAIFLTNKNNLWFSDSDWCIFE